jgi:uncharacterized protein YigE (DUF2233 family)
VLDSSLRTQITDETAKSNDDIKTKVAPSEILKDLKRLSASALEADRELNSASQRLNLASTRLQLLKIDSALLLASTLSICERMNVLLNTDSMAGRIHHIVYKGSEYRIFITDTRSHILQIHPNETGAAVPLESVWKRLLKEKGLTPLMACNAGMYNENGSAVGLCISNRRLVTKMDTNTSKMPDNFHLYPNGVFYVDSVSGYRVVKTKAMSSILKDSRNITHATQSGPMLLIDGDVHPAFIRKSSNLNVRNGIGVVESSKSR